MRGEHYQGIGEYYADLGSSPHARGAPDVAHHVLVARGIIPACAGSTTAGRLAALIRGDHPRMRGEHTSRPARLVDILA